MSTAYKVTFSLPTIPERYPSTAQLVDLIRKIIIKEKFKLAWFLSASRICTMEKQESSMNQLGHESQGLWKERKDIMDVHLWSGKQWESCQEYDCCESHFLGHLLWSLCGAWCVSAILQKASSHHGRVYSEGHQVESRVKISVVLFLHWRKPTKAHMQVWMGMDWFLYWAIIYDLLCVFLN